jgi:hypothetical protein
MSISQPSPQESATIPHTKETTPSDAPPVGVNWIAGMDDHARWAMARHEERCRRAGQ